MRDGGETINYLCAVENEIIANGKVRAISEIRPC